MCHQPRSTLHAFDSRTEYETDDQADSCDGGLALTKEALCSGSNDVHPPIMAPIFTGSVSSGTAFVYCDGSLTFVEGRRTTHPGSHWYWHLGELQEVVAYWLKGEGVRSPPKALAAPHIIRLEGCTAVVTTEGRHHVTIPLEHSFDNVRVNCTACYVSLAYTPRFSSGRSGNLPGVSKRT